MGEARELRESLEERIRTLGEYAVTLEHHPGMTIRPGDASDAPTIDRDEVVSGARPIPLWRPPDRPLDLRETIGEGGMGMVHLGVQRSLDRRVAVKAIKPDLRSPKTVDKLLQEAKVTGGLEHPNVVPVHDIASDHDGSPLIVLKRIEGVDWGRLLRDPALVRERFDAEDVLEWHLGVLMQVCNAVSFAHSRGVLHRDLKPENVMIGAFGEVYVLDWGLAVRLDDPDRSVDGAAIPRASDAIQMAGTPSYMAPEMLGGAPSRLSRKTDVYLLGAILYEILTGQPPHRGDSLIAVLHAVAVSEPAIPDDAPEELARVAQRALAKDAADRPESADALRGAIADFLRHRGANQLAREAEARLAELEALLDADDVDEERAQSLFTEARFGFRLARQSWPEHPRAGAGERRALIAMIEHELRAGDARGAARLSRDLEAAPDGLIARIEAARRGAEADRDELAQIRRDRDPMIGRRARIALTAALGGVWTLGPVAAEATGMGYARDAVSLAAPPAILLAALGLVAVALRKIAFRTAVNRRLLGAAAITMLAESSLHAGGAVAGMTPAQTHAAALVMFGVITGALALMMTPALFVPAAGYLAAFAFAAFAPEHRSWAQSAANLVFTVTVLAAWARAPARR